MAIYNLDNIKGTEHIFNVEVQEKVENGNVIKLGDYSEFDVYQGAKIADEAKDQVVFIAEQFLPYVGTESKFMTFEKGDVVRTYLLERGNRITISLDGISGTPKKGEYVIAKKGSYQLAASASVGTGLTFVVENLETVPQTSIDGALLRVI